MNGEQLDPGALGAEAAALEGEFIGREQAGAERAAEPRPPTTAEVLTPVLRAAFDVLAPAWSVSDDECGLLGQVYGDLLDKYVPEFALGPEAAALGVTLVVFGPRMKKPRKVAPAPKPADDAAPPTDR